MLLNQFFRSNKFNFGKKSILNQVSKSNTIFAQDCLGSYFLDFPKMQSIDFPFNYNADPKDSQYIILCSGINTYPIDSEFEKSINDLKDSVLTRKHIQHFQYKPLIVFQKSKDSIKIFETEFMNFSTDCIIKQNNNSTCLIRHIKKQRLHILGTILSSYKRKIFYNIDYN